MCVPAPVSAVECDGVDGDVLPSCQSLCLTQNQAAAGVRPPVTDKVPGQRGSEPTGGLGRSETQAHLTPGFH